MTNGDTSDATDLNTPLADLEADANIARPIATGGTGATSAAAALVNFGLTATAAELNTLDGITATVTELNYTDGVTSAIQTQLNGKQAADGTLTTLSALSLVAGDTLYATAADTLARLPVGTAGQSYIVNSGATAPEWGSSIALQTAVTASGQTNIDFTGIPAWVNRITITGSGLSTNGTNEVILQIGDSGGIETTGYTGSTSPWTTSTMGGVATLTGSFNLAFGSGDTAAAVRHFTVVLTKHSGNTWVAQGGGALSNAAFANAISGSKTLSDVLTQVRITTVGGVNTFDAGSVNVSWE